MPISLHSIAAEMQLTQKNIKKIFANFRFANMQRLYDINESHTKNAHRTSALPTIPATYNKS